MDQNYAQAWTMLFRQYALHPHGASAAELKKRAEHAGRVLIFSQIIADQLDSRYPLDRFLLDSAAILHDIQKFKSYRRHAVLAGAAIKKRNQDWKKKRRPFSKAECMALDGIISAHKDDFDPPYYYAEEAAVLRMADKLDKVWRASTKKELKKARRTCREHRHELKKYFISYGDRDFYEDLKSISKKMIRRISKIKGFS